MEWINVKNQLPKKEGYYLVFLNKRRCLATYSNKKWYTEEYMDDFKGEEIVFHSFDEFIKWVNENITHWTPLPEAPNE